MEFVLFGMFQIVLIQLYLIWKLYEKTKRWENTYHKTKKANADIVDRYVFKGTN